MSQAKSSWVYIELKAQLDLAWLVLNVEEQHEI